MQLLWALVHAMERTARRMRLDLGVTSPQRLVLRVVGLRPGISAGVSRSAANLTGLCGRLVRVRCANLLL